MQPPRFLRASRLLCPSFVIFALAGIAAAQPANDLCSNAIQVFAGVPQNGTNVNATGTDLSSCAGTGDTRDVWYSFTAPENGLASFTVCGASWDTTLSAFNGCGGAELACNDDDCGLQSTIVVAMTDGQTCLVRVAGYGGATGSFTLNTSFNAGGSQTGPDVVYSEVNGITNWGAVGGIRGYSLGSYTCNLGDQNLPWNSTSPLLGMNAYRLHGGRLEQIGMSWLKNATVAAAGTGCGLPCNGQGGSQLGAGCRDIYGASYNGGQGILGPRSQCNAFTGQYPGPSGGSGNAIYKRLQIRESDLQASNYPGALYFAEGIYVAATDAISGNAMNNASYRRMTVSGGALDLSPADSMNIGVPAIQAWRDHGLGVGVPDPTVEIVTADVPGEGRFYVASKVTPLGNGTWRYAYAIFNLNSHRSAGLFNVPAPASTTVTGVGFHDVDYHSGEPFDNTDWNWAVDSSGVTWASPQTYAQNQNSNALRFGTMYTYWFDADLGPVAGDAKIGLFRPGDPAQILVSTRVPGACAGDCFVDARRDGLDVQKFLDCVMGGGSNCVCGDFSAVGAATFGDIGDFVNALLFAPNCP